MIRLPFICSFVLLFASPLQGQFLDDFRAGDLHRDPRGLHGWSYFTGDGNATMDFRQGSGYASIIVDATRDRQGIWWALIKHWVSPDMDLGLLRLPHRALRIEARIRVSDAPKRVNLHLNTQRTTDFHTHLMEFDIPDTVIWHTISMTTRGFDAVPGDTVYGQLALMDWGLGLYRVDLQYVKVDIVNADSVGPDQGEQVPYHPPIPDPSSFALHVPVAADAMIDRKYPDIRLANWSSVEQGDTVRVLSSNATQFSILRWNLRPYTGQKAAGAGLLELTTYSLQRSPDYKKDFGMVRLCEILGGDPTWNQDSVTFASFVQGKALDEAINSQMIIDVEVNSNRGGKTLFTVSRPVLQRLLDGKTSGLAIKPLGAVNAAFYAGQGEGGTEGPLLHFTLAP
jgi:hypothetical protein